MRKVAIVTDAVSDDFYFPLWYKYYSTQFSPDELYVVCFDPQAAESFSKWRLGKVITKASFNNDERARHVSNIVSELTREYDYVIRVDVDEFIVPDPRRFESLRTYVENLSQPCVTAFGYNVVQGPNETALDLNSEILVTQRRFAYAYNALYKTCIVNAPTRWLPGFHVCTHRPTFGDLYLFHLKLADLDMQLRIGGAVAAMADEQQFREYHTTSKEIFLERNRQRFTKERKSGFPDFKREEYNRKFTEVVEEVNGVFWTGSFVPEEAMLEIPDQFTGFL